jgi:DNA-binding HxlR family transcriptional regulator
MQRLLKCLRVSQKPLTPNEIAMRTELLTEISQDRLFRYLTELEWSGIIVKEFNRYRLPRTPSMKIKRERKTKRVNKGVS